MSLVLVQARKCLNMNKQEGPRALDRSPESWPKVIKLFEINLRLTVSTFSSLCSTGTHALAQRQSRTSKMAAHVNQEPRQIQILMRRPRVFKDCSYPLEDLDEGEVFRCYRFKPPTIMYILDKCIGLWLKRYHFKVFPFLQ